MYGYTRYESCTREHPHHYLGNLGSNVGAKPVLCVERDRDPSISGKKW